MIPRRARAVLLIGYWIALAVATHLPPAHMVPLRGPWTDDLVHGVSFAILALGVVWAMRPSGSHWLAWAVGLAAYAAIDECTQPLVGRVADPADWTADMMGVALGLLLGSVIGRMARRREQTTPDAVQPRSSSS